MEKERFWIWKAVKPYADMLPTKLPALVPTIRWIGTRFASRILRVPICVNPREAPAPRTRATFAGGLI